MGFLKAIAMVACAGMVWIVLAAEVPRPVRILPVSSVVFGAKITQPFGCTDLALEPFDAFCPQHHIHTGIDLAASPGADVHSVTSGVARLGDDPGGAGLYVVVSVDSRVRVLYCHLSDFRVRSGESVLPGQVLGLLGTTGNSTGPHVHLEVQVDGRPVDPATWIVS
jgi:murein DD-endopeptidase MepM/ murein hydrolase activator NlpD